MAPGLYDGGNEHSEGRPSGLHRDTVLCSAPLIYLNEISAAESMRVRMTVAVYWNGRLRSSSRNKARGPNRDMFGSPKTVASAIGPVMTVPIFSDAARP